MTAAAVLPPADPGVGPQAGAGGAERMGGLTVPAIAEGTDVLTAALAYAGAGWYVGPVRRGTKHPGSVLGKSWQHLTSRDPRQIAAWFAGADHGVFLHAGRSGAVVLDDDRPGDVPVEWGRALAGAPFQRTREGAGGAGRGHHVFAMPAGRSIGNPGWAGGEVRGVNGVIVVEPSVHAGAAAGGRYRWVRTGPVPVLPEAIAAVLPDGRAGTDAASDAAVAAFRHRFTGPGTADGGRGAMAVPLTRYATRTAAGASRHETAVEMACWIARDAACGLYPAAVALDLLGEAFAADFDPAERLTGRGCAGEYGGIVAWAVGQLSAERIKQHRARLNAREDARAGARTDAHVGARADARVTAGEAAAVLAGAAEAELGGGAVGVAAPSTAATPDTGQDAVPQDTGHRPGDAQDNTYDMPPIAGEDPATTGGRAGVANAAGTTGAFALANLPREVWGASAALGVIRAAALSRVLSPDAVLGCVLVRLSAFIRPSVRVDTGLGRASLNLAVVVVGDSSAGKSEAWRCARDLLPVPGPLPGMPDNDGLPLGSGEGLAEAFYGLVEEGTGEEFVSGPRKGQEKTRTVRKKVADHALFFADEGEALVRMMERSGATIAPEIRKAWKAETLGQANASAERRRIVPDGSYALGMVLGFQPGTIGPLFDDAAGGTPQRFWFVSAHSDDVSDGGAEGTGGIGGAGEAGGAGSWPGGLRNVGHMLPTGDLELPDAAKAALRAARVAARRVGAAPSGLNGHAPLHLAKLSALLAVLDLRDKVTEADWELAQVLWKTSCGVRDGLADAFSAQRAARRAAEDDRAVTVAARSAVAGERAAAMAAVRRVAQRVAVLVCVRGVRSVSGKAGVRQAVVSRDRGWVDEAVIEAADRGWITVSGDVVEPGPRSAEVGRK